MNQPYVTAEYSRHTGLGNKLFPWARAKIYAKENGVPMLRQRWVSIRGAGVTRGGIDYMNFLRKIYLFDNFRNDADEVSALNKPSGAVVVRSLLEAKNLSQNRGTVVFKWDAEHNFSELAAHHGHIVNKIHAITKDKWKASVDNLTRESHIGLNIRCGNDFAPQSDTSSTYRKTDILWYVEALAKLRARNIKNPAFIVTDGPASILGNFKGIANVHYIQTGAAIADLLLLSRASILLGCGPSSFSAWAGFLGGMPTFTSAATPACKYKIPPPFTNPFDIDLDFSP